VNLHNIEFIVIPFLYSKYFSGSLVLGSGPGSSVGIATGYELDSPGIESRWGRDFSHLSRPALRITQPACTMGTGSFSGDKSGRGVTLTPHPFLAPWSRKSRGIPLLPLWAVRPVQSLSACSRVHLFVDIARSKRDGTRAETRFGLSANRTSPFKSAGASVQSTTGSRRVRISGQQLYRPYSDV